MTLFSFSENVNCYKDALRWLGCSLLYNFVEAHAGCCEVFIYLCSFQIYHQFTTISFMCEISKAMFWCSGHFGLWIKPVIALTWWGLVSIASIVKIKSKLFFLITIWHQTTLCSHLNVCITQQFWEIGGILKEDNGRNGVLSKPFQ